MSSIQGARAISLALSDDIEEREHVRVFVVESTSGNHYTVVFGAYPVRGSAVGAKPVCNCPAGVRGVECYHVKAARLVMAREREDAGEVRAVAERATAKVRS